MCRLRNIALESVTDRKCDRRTDRRTDDRQNDPHVSLCFAGDTKRSFNLRLFCVAIQKQFLKYFKSHDHFKVQSTKAAQN